MARTSDAPKNRIGTTATAAIAAAARDAAPPSFNNTERVRLAEAGNALVNAPTTLASPCARISRVMSGRAPNARATTVSSSVPIITIATAETNSSRQTRGSSVGRAPGGQPDSTGARSPTSGSPDASLIPVASANTAPANTASNAIGNFGQRFLPIAMAAIVATLTNNGRHTGRSPAASLD